jgi:hypothetical protein
MVFKQGQQVEKVVGADVQKLRKVVQDLANMATTGGAGSSNSSAGGDWRDADLPRGYSDVSDQVDLKGLELLNADTEYGTFRTLLESSKPSALNAKGKTTATKDWVQSDTDEQLMCFMPFQAILKVHTIQVYPLFPFPPEDSDFS